MSSQQLDEEAIFHVARQITNVEGRAAYLLQACVGDQGLRERVEALLEVHENEQAFLNSDPDAAPTVDHAPLTEHPGTTIGRYKLMEQIGEGGMGTVFVAEQERPIRRKVALKVIKPGMDSKAVVARFEAERQALALMDHPNIAKVLDAGTTESGRPYFVMELVRGIPITEYCDEHKLTIRERLELFTQVCQAIQHAHQKAIIHRDVKPTNVLVTEQDGKPVPKVIDFGVAKALNQRLTDRTIYTSFAQVVGTPLYMSPEQAALSAVDVDTRSDVYSLGVLLYELLTGTTPFDRPRFEQVAHEEIRRIVREEEPPKPSTKISTLGDQGSTVAQNRRTDHEKLGRAVRGDLDWIVMKALEKERNRRYRTADALAADIGRHLSNAPVEARPPSTAYRLSRFFRRNRLLVGVAALVFFVTIAAVTATTVAWWEADRQRISAVQHATEAHQLATEMQEILTEFALLQAVAGEVEKVEETLAAYEERIDFDGKEWLPTLRGAAYFHRGDNPNAIRELESVVGRSPDDIAATALLSVAYVHEGYVDKGLALANQLRNSSPPSVMNEIEQLFYGYCVAYLDYEAGARILDGVLARHPTWAIARVYRAAMRAHVSEQTDNVVHVTAALQEFAVVRPFVKDNAYALMADLFVHKEAIEMYQRHGRAVDDLVEAALPVAHQLRRAHPAYQTGQLIAGQFYDLVGEKKWADEAWDNVLDIHSGWWGCAIARYCLTHGNAEALNRINKAENRDPAQDVARALILADDPLRRDEAILIFQDLSQNSMTALQAVTIPLLLGERKMAEAHCLRWLEQNDSDLLSNRRAEYQVTLIGRPTRARPPEDNLMLRSVYDYVQGVLAISDGNRDLALYHLEECVELGPILPLHYWAKVFAGRLQEDEDWPRANKKIKKDVVGD